MIYVKIRDSYPNDMVVLASGDYAKRNPIKGKPNEYFPIKTDSYELRELIRQHILILKPDDKESEELKIDLDKEEINVKNIINENLNKDVDNLNKELDSQKEIFDTDNLE
jgi:hypothetical protein